VRAAKDNNFEKSSVDARNFKFGTMIDVTTREIIKFNYGESECVQTKRKKQNPLFMP
jgi:hypothetical protein